VEIEDDDEESDQDVTIVLTAIIAELNNIIVDQNNSYF
jgi:hypothetical protein